MRVPLEVQLCDCMQILRENFRGLDEVLAQRNGAEFDSRLENIRIAAQVAQSIWASIRKDV